MYLSAHLLIPVFFFFLSKILMLPETSLKQPKYENKLASQCSETYNILNYFDTLTTYF